MQIQRRLCQDAMAPYLTQGNFLLMLLRAVQGLPCIRNYPARSIRPTRLRLTPSIGYEFLQCISKTTAAGKTLPIEVMPVANCHDNNRSQYLGGGLNGPVVVSSIQAMQSIIQSTRLLNVIIRCNDPTIGSYNDYHLSPNSIPSGNQGWYGLVYIVYK